jgi:hypothetical protein
MALPDGRDKATLAQPCCFGTYCRTEAVNETLRMSRARDIIQEIAEVRERRRFGSAAMELPLRLLELEGAFDKYDKASHELTRYFPVALIACVEGYFRLAIKDLIDAGEPYLTNAEKLASSIRLDFSMVRAVHGRSVTVGELIAHSAQISRLEHVDGNLSILLGKNLLESLRTVTSRWAHEVRGEPIRPILDKPEAVFADVARTFELRHIICHEIASAYEIEVKEVARCFESCMSFLRAADELVSETIHPGAPLTQSPMNEAAGKSLNARRGALDEAVKTLRARLDKSRVGAFDESQVQWDRYCEAWANFVAGEREGGGTIWPLIFAGAAEVVVERRIEELKSFRELGWSVKEG